MHTHKPCTPCPHIAALLFLIARHQGNCQGEGPGGPGGDCPFVTHTIPMITDQTVFTSSFLLGSCDVMRWCPHATPPYGEELAVSLESSWKWPRCTGTYRAVRMRHGPVWRDGTPTSLLPQL